MTTNTRGREHTRAPHTRTRAHECMRTWARERARTGTRAVLWFSSVRELSPQQRFLKDPCLSCVQTWDEILGELSQLYVDFLPEGRRTSWNSAAMSRCAGMPQLWRRRRCCPRTFSTMWDIHYRSSCRVGTSVFRASLETCEKREWRTHRTVLRFTIP